MSRRFLRPMSIGEILDAAFTMYRHHFTTYVKIAAFVYVPLLVLSLVESWIAMVALMFAPVIAMVAILKAVAGHMTEEPVTTGECFKTALRKWFPVFASYMVISVFIAFGFLLLVVPGVLLIAMWFAWMPILVLEHDWNFPGRSRALAKGAWSKILAVKLITTLILIFPQSIVSVAQWVMTPEAMTDPVAAWNPPFIVMLATVVMSCLTVPFKVLVDTMLYYERRVVVDGYDVELATSQLGDAPVDE